MEIRLNEINMLLPHSRTTLSILLSKAVKAGAITRIKNGIYLKDEAFLKWIDDVNEGRFVSTQKPTLGLGKGHRRK